MNEEGIVTWSLLAGDRALVSTEEESDRPGYTQSVQPSAGFAIGSARGIGDQMRLAQSIMAPENSSNMALTFKNR
jgi:hypothetical protein